MADLYREQGRDDIFALDIGTRSIIGIVGRVENGRLHVLAIEKENHGQRAMLDGQIEDIGKVAAVARIVIDRLEKRLKMKLAHACVAAAGRALKSEQASFRLELPSVQKIDDETIGQLEAGAVSRAEEEIMSQPDQQNNRFYMVGYTAAQYRLDGYPLLTLKSHTGRVLEADVVATFLPREVVESLYAVVAALGLDVASLTLEPIASLNAAIPADIRLLNLVLVDIGAGTSDIAICQDGSVVGYTMATVAGDEVTELLMRNLLVDFQTGERLKMELAAGKPVKYTDILGIEHVMDVEKLRELIQPSIQALAQEIAGRVMEINGKVPSAVFLAGGGSKLEGLRQAVSEALNIDPGRVAIAGNHFQRNAFSDNFELDDPEYATPLGIAISAGLGLINDSYVVNLNGEPAKLFRSGALTLRDILLMNGYHYKDLIGRTGANLSVTLNGKQLFFRGSPPVQAQLTLNGKPAELSDLAHAGDNLEFSPAESGEDAKRTLGQILGEKFTGQVIVNGARAALEDYVCGGDDIWAELTPDMAVTSTGVRQTEEDHSEPPAEEEQKASGTPLAVTINGREITLPGKPGGEAYYLMDVLEYSGVDFDNLEKPVELWVNGGFGQFSQELHEKDNIVIR